MDKRILVSSTDLMMVQFLLPHIENLSENGYTVDIACSNVGNRIDEIREKTKAYVNKLHIIRTVRSPFSLNNIKGYKDMTDVINENDYDCVWTNEPVMGVVTRLAARKKRKQRLLKVLYMAHGFHFYKGAPLINWLLFFPVEWLASFITDCLVTVNLEDFERAKKLHAKEVRYIHGIGINTDRLSKTSKTDIKKELSLKDDDFLVLSVGELNKNKNQKTIIKALAKIDNKDIHYILCGKGVEEHNLRALCRELNVADRVHFLGYRTDVVDICAQADVYVMPSLREGLPVASLEAMYCGLPLITSSIRGLQDIMVDGVSGYLCNPTDAEAFAKYIKTIKNDKNLRKSMAEKNKEIVIPYCIENTIKVVYKLFSSL